MTYKIQDPGIQSMDDTIEWGQIHEMCLKFFSTLTVINFNAFTVCGI